MTTSASALPALAPNDEGRKVVERVNAIIRWFNRPDLFVPSYAPDTGTGAAYVTTPSADIKVYEVGQEFDFKAANANTVTNPTLNVQGLGAGTITKLGGAALTIGDIAANSFNKVIVATTAPTFELISPVAVAAINNTGATTFLGANVGTGTATTFASGPNTGSIGASGQVWLITATATVTDTAAAQFIVDLFNGTASIGNTTLTVAIANTMATGTVSAVVTLSAATTFTLRVSDITNNSGTILTTGVSPSAANKATSITAVRLA